MGQRVLEVCVDSLESALAARAGGATRLELCANLVIGGTTPGLPLLRAVKGDTGLPVHALLRPRFGDFLYTGREFALLLEEGEALLDQGADALVCGCLTPQGELDLPRMEQLVGLAHSRGRKFTLHRAFDLCRDPFRALEECKALGVDTVLTSGQAPSCREGKELLGRLAEAAGPVEVLVGAGVDAAAVRELGLASPGLRSFHMSGKVALESGMEYRRQGVPMGLPGLSEFEIWRTDPGKVRAAWEELQRL